MQSSALKAGDPSGAPREGGWHHVSHASSGREWHRGSVPHASRRAGGISLESQEESPRAGAARGEAIALDDRREQYRRLRRRVTAPGDPRCQCTRRLRRHRVQTFLPRQPPTSTSLVAGFDPVTQAWTITLDSPLPPIKSTLQIDGYSQARSGGVPFRYPNASVRRSRRSPSRAVPRGDCSSCNRRFPVTWDDGVRHLECQRGDGTGGAEPDSGCVELRGLWRTGS